MDYLKRFGHGATALLLALFSGVGQYSDGRFAYLSGTEGLICIIPIFTKPGHR